MHAMPLPNIHLLGIQGSGKGTQARLLAERLEFTVLPTGELFRDEVKRRTALGIEIEQRLQRGELMTTSELHDVVDRFLAVTPIPHGLIGDGTLRTVEQIEVLDPLWSHYALDKPLVIYFELSEAVARDRILERKKQERNDDHEEAIARRITTFMEHNEPIRSYYQNHGRLITLDAHQPVSVVFEQVLQQLRQHYPNL
jgi:adenylate kinase